MSKHCCCPNYGYNPGFGPGMGGFPGGFGACGFGGNNSWWIILLILFCFCGNGFRGNNNCC